MISSTRRRISVFVMASIVLTSASLMGHSAPVSAQQGVQAIRISSFQVNTLDGKSALGQALMAGAGYKIQFTLEIAPGLKDKSILKTDLSRSGDRYWSLTGPYQGIDTNSWQPGQSQIAFDAVEGKVQLELQGKVPDDFVTSGTSIGETLHLSKEIPLLEVSLASGRVLETRTQEVIDKPIETYRALLKSKEAVVNQSKADPRFVDLVKLIVSNSKAESDRGHIDLATDMLRAVPESGWIQPQSSNLVQWVAIGILGLAAILLFLLFFRSRNELGFARRRIDEHAKRLEILVARVRGIGDSKLAGEIDRVKQEMEEVSGR